MAAPLLEPRGIPTIFGEVLEKNVAFCIDTSGSMYRGLDMVKEHLIETLLKIANSGKPYMFNIVEFNSEVTQWADKMVTCTPQTVAVAKEWVNKLSAKTGTNTKGALLTALNDPRCDAVYLVTDGLPDHHPVEILDHVGNIGKMRPIHCVYLTTDETTESAAIEFLEDLSIESYGSFHIVNVSTHGYVERITPIYRAEHANERVIRTLNGTVRPNIKKCSVATTLQVDPEECISLAPRAAMLRPPGPCCPPWFDWMGAPYRYYYPYAWSRYRPARGWLKAQEAMRESLETEGLSPAAGSLLISKKVLARRIDDGYFYLGTVKSQILSDKFLVGFGPCKHGKYNETVYQDTYVYDIIDYEDARRHTILTGDRVLAPWEPEGERYGPGTVLEGHEKRNAEGPDDKEITVSFTNGKVEKVSQDTAIWLHQEVHERLALELKMPREAREALGKEEGYPLESMTGYPTSGPEASPEQYELSDPLYFPDNPVVMDRSWRYPVYPPPYPMIVQTGERRTCETTAKAKSVVKSEDMDAIVPGTNLTQKQLDERVTSQLREHQCLLGEKGVEKGTSKDEKETEKGTNKEEKDVCETVQTTFRVSDEEELRARLAERRREWEKSWEREEEMIQWELEKKRLLQKRNKQEENTLKKSVTFEDKSVERDVKVENLEETEDSGLGTGRLVSAVESQLEPDTYFSDPEDEMTSIGVNTDSSLLYRRRARGRLVPRPPWKKYWRADPGMPVTNNYNGPFRETALQAPLEARNQNPSAYINEWTSPVYRFVDPLAKHAYTDSVEKLMTHPHPPTLDRSVVRPEPIRPMSADTKEAARREFKRRQEAQRQLAWNMKQQNFEHMSEVMKDQHKERIQGQLAREKERQYMEQKVIEQSRENKKFISKEVRVKIEKNQKREADREEQRIRAMSRRRELRENAQQQRNQLAVETHAHREAMKAQRSQERWDAVQTRLDNEEKENSRKSLQFHNAKLQRIQHFQNLEEQGQRLKDVRIGPSTARNSSIFQSTSLI